MGTPDKYADIADLPEEEVASYSKSQRAAYKNAWNRAVEKGKDERDVRAEAHIQAKQASNGND